MHERARRLAIEQSNKSAEEYAEVGLGLSARHQGRLDDAEAHFTKWLDWLPQVGGTPGIAFILAQLGFIAEQRGDLTKAHPPPAGLRSSAAVGDERAIALALEGLAGAAEDPDRAHQLLARSRSAPRDSGCTTSAGGALRRREDYFPSQASTFDWLSLTHFSAAASGVSLSTAIYRATAFWSSLVHWKFFTRSYAGLPESANFFATILSRSYGG